MLGGSEVLRKQNEDFWNNFLEKNHHHQTEVFGGSLPVYIPQMPADERQYEEEYEGKYVSNVELRMTEKMPESEVRKVNKVKDDINFVRNLSLQDGNAGFGSF